MSERNGATPEIGGKWKDILSYWESHPVPATPDTLDDIRRTLIMRMAAAEIEWDHGMLTDDDYLARKDDIVAEVTGLFRDTLRRTMGLEAPHADQS